MMKIKWCLRNRTWLCISSRKLNTAPIQSLQGRRKQTEDALQSLLQSREFDDNIHSHPHVPNTSVEDITQLTRRLEELAQEAQGITFQLFRACLRSVRSLDPSSIKQTTRPTHASKEDEPLKNFSWINPQDSLDSRYWYYVEKTREGFYQDRDCLAMPRTILLRDSNKDKDTLVAVWRMNDIDRFVYLIQKGEEMRSWILKEYQMEDRWSDGILNRQRRVDQFEHDAKEYIKSVYRFKGWELPTETIERVDGWRDEDIDDELFWRDEVGTKDK